MSSANPPPPSATFLLSVGFDSGFSRLRPYLRCLGCESDLELHQPDPEDPYRFLGTCADCGSWHVIYLAGPFSVARLARMPDRGQVAAAIDSLGDQMS